MFSNKMFLRICFCISFFSLFFSNPLLASKSEISGQVIGEPEQGSKENAKPLAFATLVVLDSAGRTLAGTASDAEGNFTLSGNWKKEMKLICSCIGYQKHEQSIQWTNRQDKHSLGKIVLKEQSSQMKEVVISARSIKREADRYVVKLEGSEKIIGKSALDVVSESPGVWVGSDKLAVNGKTGTIVIVNNRVLKMEFEDLKRYLSTLKAEEVQKIEVIPNAGAEYDADARGGVIKITLRKQRKNGLDGSVGSKFEYSSKDDLGISPNLNLNLKSNDFQFYASGTMTEGKYRMDTRQKTTYRYADPDVAISDLPRISEGTGELRRGNNFGNYRLGAIYDISKNQSVGIEYEEYFQRKNNGKTSSHSLMQTDSLYYSNASIYNHWERSQNRSLSANYILTLDSLGSQFKLVGDYLTNVRPTSDIYENERFESREDPRGFMVLGNGVSRARYTTSSEPIYDVLTLSADLNYVFKGGSRLASGLKVYNNQMISGQLYKDYLFASSSWQKNDMQSFHNKYREQITAAYAKFTTRWKILNIAAGLRAEHTDATPKTTQTFGDSIAVSRASQHYWDFFPNLNISIPLDAKGSNSLVFSYNRTISRPSFWRINPFRTQLSEYSYVCGNPKLRPNITEDVSMTFVWKSVYSFTAGMTIEKDEIQQSGSIDSLNPDVFLIRFENIDRSKSYYISMNIPYTIAPWWSLSANVNGVLQEVYYQGETRNNPFVQGNIVNNFTLPWGLQADISAWGCSKVLVGNMDVDPMYSVSCGFKKLFLDKKLSVSLRFANMIKGSSDIRIAMSDKKTDPALLSNPRIPIETKNYTHATNNFPSIRLGITYNFNSGEKFKAKKVENAADDVSKRMAQ